MADALATVRKHFGRALPAVEAIDRAQRLILEQFWLGPHDVLWAESTCGDELNAHATSRHPSGIGGPFRLGGLGGFPFVGTTGFAACVSHVPTDGAFFLSYGPHVGISRAGEVGLVDRLGMDTPTTSCGAAAAAWERLRAGQIVAGELDTDDFQMSRIEQILLESKGRLQGAATPMAEVTEVLMEAIEAEISKLLVTARGTLPCRYVFRLGVILVNSSSDGRSYYVPRHLSCLHIETGEEEDLLPQLFG